VKKESTLVKKYPCGEVCLGVMTDNSAFDGLTLQQYSDSLYNNLKAEKGQSKSLEYNTNSKFGGKKAFEMLDEIKQGNRECIEKMKGTAYPDPDAYESKTFLDIQFKTRDKYSDEMLPLANTMIDSFRFTKNSTQ
jgi:hypothetical protein